MHWVLMALLLGPNSERTTLSMQEFNTKAACEYAVAVVRNNARDPRDIKAVLCVPKGK